MELFRSTARNIYLIKLCCLSLATGTYFTNIAQPSLAKTDKNIKTSSSTQKSKQPNFINTNRAGVKVADSDTANSGATNSGTTDSGTTNTGATTSLGTSPSQSQLLSTSAKQTEQQLRRFGEVIKRLKRATVDLASECTQPVEMAGEIDIIGADVIPIMPQTAEGFGGQYIPPRPKYINLHMGQIDQLMPILHDDLASLNIPDQEKDFAAPIIADINSTLKDVVVSYKNLKGLTIGPDYDQTAISDECNKLLDSVKKIDNGRKKLLKEDRKEERQSKHS